MCVDLVKGRGEPVQRGTTTTPNPQNSSGGFVSNSPETPFGAAGEDRSSDVARFRRRGFLLGSLGVAAVGFLAACGGSDDSDGGGGGGSSAGKTDMVVAVATLVQSLNGTIDGTGTFLEAFEMNANLNAGLVRNPYIDNAETAGTVVQDFNEYVGYVADSYEVSADGTVYTFHLRDGFSDAQGNPITADDVVYSFERKWASEKYSRGIWNGYFNGPDDITKVDDLTVEFHMSKPGFGPTFLGVLANSSGHIWSKTILEANATADDPYAMAWSAANGGWGLGPYYVSDWTPDQEMILTANPNYAYGEVAITKVTLRVVPDAGTRASLVSTGDVQAAESILPTDQVKLKSNKDLVIPVVADPIAYVDLTLVCNKAPFDNRLVRQAFAKALPYDDIMSQIFAGQAVYKVGNINPSFTGYSIDGLPVPATDIDGAKALLAEAGVDRVSFELSVSTANADLVNACVLVKSFAEDAGFDVTIKQMSAQDFQTARVNGTDQAIIYLNRAQVQTEAYSCVTFFQPNNSTASPSRWEDEYNDEFWGYVNQALDIQDQTSSEAGALYNKAQKVMIESAAEIFVCAIQPTQVYRTELEGFTYRSENAYDWGNMTYV